MPLNPLYVLAPSLEMYFVDKDSGLPLANGQVFFFVDGTNTPKDIYELSGVAPDYGYTVLPNPITLSAVGTFQDGDGNNILPYYYPYDVDGNLELYFIEVYNSNGVLQFTRSGWPNSVIIDEGSGEDITNYVPNGQFILHNNPSAAPLSGAQITTTVNYGSPVGTQSVYQIAQGGWTFERPQGSTATDDITFIRFGGAVGDPSGNPRYQLQLATTVSSSDGQKDICLKFPDVNTFSSPGNTLAYNLFFTMATPSSVGNIQVLIRKYFGTGGSAAVEIPTSLTIDGASLDATPSPFNVTLQFGTNETYTIGPNDDDYVQVIFRVNPAGTGTIQLCDVCITINDDVLNAFPQQTEAQQIAPSTAGFIVPPGAPLTYPAYDGSQFYLPLVLTAQGITYDYSQVGEIVAKLSLTSAVNELPMNGASYLFSDYSPSGIPYSRIGNYLIANSPVANTPLMGTGINFATAAIVGGQPTEFYLTMNTSGGVTAPTSSTGAISFTGTDPSYTGTVNTIPAYGSYFTFVTNPSVPASYFVWFSNGSTTQPILSGTGIEVILTGSDTTTTTATKILIAINSQQFALFNLAGYFLRALDTTGAVDPDYASRTNSQIGVTGAYLATIEPQAFLNHVHYFDYAHSGVGSGGTNVFTTSGSGGGSLTGNSPTGGAETRPINFAVNYFIKI